MTLTATVQFSDIERWDPALEATFAMFSWPHARLDEVADVRLGIQVPRKGSSSTGVTRPYLRAFNVRRGVLDLTDVKTMQVSPTYAGELTLQAGDLLFVEGSGSVSEVGRVALWDGSVQGVIHQNSVVRARLRDDRFEPSYLLTWFNSRAGNSYIRQQATTTSGLYHIGAGKLAGAPIPLAPLEVQRRIVADYQCAIAASAEADRRAVEIVDRAWDRFETHLVEPPLEAATSGMVTIARFALLQRWDTDAVQPTLQSQYPLLTLEDVAEVTLGTQVPRKGSNTAGTDVPYLRAANVQRGHLDLRDVKLMTVSDSTVERLRLMSGDVLFVEGNSREEVGRSAVWVGASTTTIIQNSVVRVRLRSADLFGPFVSSWFNSRAGRRYVLDQATTTSGSLWHIGAGKLAKAPLPVPPLHVQRRLVAELESGLAQGALYRREAVARRAQAESDLEAALLQGAEAT